MYQSFLFPELNETRLGYVNPLLFGVTSAHYFWGCLTICGVETISNCCTEALACLPCPCSLKHIKCSEILYQSCAPLTAAHAVTGFQSYLGLIWIVLSYNLMNAQPISPTKQVHLYSCVIQGVIDTNISHKAGDFKDSFGSSWHHCLLAQDHGTQMCRDAFFHCQTLEVSPFELVLWHWACDYLSMFTSIATFEHSRVSRYYLR